MVKKDWAEDRDQGKVVRAAIGYLDSPPAEDGLTDYDRAHLQLYMRLLDAAAEGAEWEEVVAVLFAIDAAQEPDRARRVHESHLARAQWMTRSGYKHLLRRRLN